MAHEISEHIEHAGHDHGHGGSLTRWIGITIAMLGVLMLLGLLSVSMAGGTFIVNRAALHGAEEKIEAAHHEFKERSNDAADLKADDDLMKSVENDIEALEKLKAQNK